jgi:hypothetical protein
MVPNCKICDILHREAVILDGLRVCPGTHDDTSLLMPVIGAASGLPARILGLHAVLSILLPYANKRLRIHALSNAWPDAPSSDRRRRVWDALLKLESTHATFSLLNFILFLWNGRSDISLFSSPGERHN